MVSKLVLVSGLLALCLTGFLEAAKEKGKKNEKKNVFRLPERLLRKYNPQIRPNVTGSPVEVSFSMSIMDVEEVVERSKQAAFTIVAWPAMSWNDPRLSWSGSEYPKVDSLRFSTDSIWMPDIMLYNNLITEPSLDPSISVVVQRYRGSANYIIPLKLKVHCPRTDPTSSASDWTCQFKFGSWTYDGHSLNLTNSQQEADISTYNNAEWEVAENNVVRSVKLYDCCVEPYIDLQYTVRFRKND